MDIKTMARMLEDKEPFEVLGGFIDNNKTNDAINYIKQYCNCDDATAKTLFVDFKIDYDKIFSASSTLSPQEIAHNNAVAQEWSNKPKCPTCGSINVSKISSLSKAANTAMFGIFGQKRKHQFKCNNCKYEW